MKFPPANRKCTTQGGGVLVIIRSEKSASFEIMTSLCWRAKFHSSVSVGAGLRRIVEQQEAVG